MAVKGEEHLARIDVVDVPFLEVLEGAVGIDGVISIFFRLLVIVGSPVGILVLLAKVQERLGYQPVHVVPRFPVCPLFALRFRHALRIACLRMSGKGAVGGKKQAYGAYECFHAR